METRKPYILPQSSGKKLALFLLVHDFLRTWHTEGVVRDDYVSGGSWTDTTWVIARNVRGKIEVRPQGGSITYLSSR